MPSIRDAALAAGVSADNMVRARMLRVRPARIAIGAGVLTAGAVWALAHLIGADLRALTGTQGGLLTPLLPAQSEAGAHAAAPPEQP